MPLLPLHLLPLSYRHKKHTNLSRYTAPVRSNVKALEACSGFTAINVHQPGGSGAGRPLPTASPNPPCLLHPPPADVSAAFSSLLSHSSRPSPRAQEDNQHTSLTLPRIIDPPPPSTTGKHAYHFNQTLFTLHPKVIQIPTLTRPLMFPLVYNVPPLALFRLLNSPHPVSPEPLRSSDCGPSRVEPFALPPPPPKSHG